MSWIQTHKPHVLYHVSWLTILGLGIPYLIMFEKFRIRSNNHIIMTSWRSLFVSYINDYKCTITLPKMIPYTATCKTTVTCVNMTFGTSVHFMLVSLFVYICVNSLKVPLPALVEQYSRTLKTHFLVGPLSK